MPQVTIQLKGYNRVRNDLRKLASANSEIVDPVMRDFARAQQRVLKARPYPAKRPGQRYIRTGRLASSFRVRKLADAQYSLTNSAPYASFVIGDKQAWMHKGRWWQMSSVIGESLPELRRAIEAKIKSIWNDAT